MSIGWRSARYHDLGFPVWSSDPVGFLAPAELALPPKGGLSTTDKPMTLHSHECRDQFSGRKARPSPQGALRPASTLG